jgi:glycosyltransferase involved in cell wall biosynthesis
MAATGLDLFCAAIARLDGMERSIGRRIEFIVTGVGDLNRICDLASALRSDWLHIEMHQGIARGLYFDLLDGCHASLSLRSPESEYSSTTFPSKVIEITSRGLALVSTRVSDVADIFTDDTAWLLPRFSDQAFSDILREMARNPAEVRRRADAGQVLARARFAPLAVGRALAEFLDVGPKSP